MEKAILVLVWIELQQLVEYQSLNKRVGGLFVMKVGLELQECQVITEWLITVSHLMSLLIVNNVFQDQCSHKGNPAITVSPISIQLKILESQCIEKICKIAQVVWDKTYSLQSNLTNYKMNTLESKMKLL